MRRSMLLQSYKNYEFVLALASHKLNDLFAVAFMVHLP